MANNHRWVLIIGVLPLFLFSTVGIAQNNEAVPVRTETVSVDSIRDTLTLAGSVNSLQRAELSTEIDGHVSQINVDVGSRVKKGELLLLLDKDLALQALSQAQAAVEKAQAEYTEAQRAAAEAKKLVQENHIAKSELLTRENMLRAAKAVLSEAVATKNYQQTLVNKHQLFAPFNGLIVQRNAELGEWHSRGSNVLTLVSTEQLRTDVYLPQEKFAQLDRIETITLIPDTNPDVNIKAEIATTVPVGTEGARSFLVRLKAPENKALVPGTSAVAKLEFALEQKGVIISRDALLRHADGGYSAFVVENGLASRRQLQLGKDAMSGVVVLSGLGANDEVIVRGNEVLQDGQAVSIITDEKKRGGN